MREIELELLIQYHNHGDDLSKQEIVSFISQPLGQSTQEFREIIKRYGVFNYNYAGILWLDMETYLQPEQKEDIKAQTLIKIETLLQQDCERKKSGTLLMTIPKGLIKQIYLSGDAALIDLMVKHVPIPPSRLFDEGKAPEWIKAREQAAYNTIESAIQKVGTEDLKKHEQAFIKVQRALRKKLRLQQEIHRITQHHQDELKYLKMTAEQLMQDANTPYIPRCDPALAKRIMNAAKKVSAFSSVKHITSSNTLQSVLDDALYGRKTLLDYYMTFNPAALADCDVLNGDANVVCLGPNDIDPSVRGAIVIEFDLPSLIKTKPSAFYKQRDLGYDPTRTRSVMLGRHSLLFDHSGIVRTQRHTKMSLQIKSSECDQMLYASQLTNSTFIAYNLEQIHSILTLNFFRFIDTLQSPHGLQADEYTRNFYRKISALNNDELVEFLTDLEQKMTDTSEFNFYGAHQLNFSTITSICDRHKGYTLHLQTFIEALNHGDLNELRKAREKLPGVFQSYRFMDYLLVHVQHPESRYYLDDARQHCKTPAWVHYTPIETSECRPIQWKLETNVEVEHVLSPRENIIEHQLLDTQATDENVVPVAYPVLKS